MDKKHHIKKHHHSGLLGEHRHKGLFGRLVDALPNKLANERIHVFFGFVLFFIIVFQLYSFMLIRELKILVHEARRATEVQGVVITDEFLKSVQLNASDVAQLQGSATAPAVVPLRVPTGDVGFFGEEIKIHQVPPLPSCTADDRGFGSFSCSGFPTEWVLGTEPYLQCYTGSSVPTCPIDQVFSCNTGQCECAQDKILCNGVCSLKLDPGTCPVGTTVDYCTGRCT